MSVFVLPEQLAFPAPKLADDNGLLAVGGDLSPERLLLAYSCGIFPWNHPDDPLLWWSPDPRCVLFPDQIHVSRSLAKTLRSNRFRISYNQAFELCMEGCSSAGQRAQGTWISPQIKDAYAQLHRLGFAHSVECWEKDQLVGGLYGIALGRYFCGESMFHLRPDASKTALVALAQQLDQRGYQMIDCQLPTAHLHSLGACDIPREQFLERLQQCGIWHEDQFRAGDFPTGDDTEITRANACA
ncbi:MAG: leucyl/phenylalanyl-tRNA--protein transferase [Desulfuromonadaceae bacterium]|nr:leucyl/phenylalanyl-tRNA--protein transferase [Desulfuromonadaceae bacterium]